MLDRSDTGNLWVLKEDTQFTGLLSLVWSIIQVLGNMDKSFATSGRRYNRIILCKVMLRWSEEN